MIEITDDKKRLLLKTIDNIIRLVYAVLSPVLFMNSKKTSAIDRILLIRLDHIGDAAIASPAPRLIKEKYPGAKITMMIGSWAIDAFKNNPYIDEIICHDAPWWSSIRPGAKIKILPDYLINDYIPLLKKLKKEKFDIGIDFRGDIRHIILFLLLPRIKQRLSYDRTGGGFLLSQYAIYDKKLREIQKDINLLGIIGVKTDIAAPDIYITDSERSYIDRLFKENRVKETDKKIVLSPGARSEIKRWPLENFITLGALLEKKYNARVIFTGISPEINRNLIPVNDKFINLVDRLNLLQLTALFEKSSLFISNDSGAAHIASSRDIPIIALFGPTDPDIYKPVSKNMLVIKARGKCMANISVEEAVAAAERFL